MSTYYNYYLVGVNKDNSLNLDIGLFDKQGNRLLLDWYSKSFAPSEDYELFEFMEYENAAVFLNSKSDDVNYTEDEINSLIRCQNISFARLDKLERFAKSKGLVKGYLPIETIDRMEKEPDDYDLCEEARYEVISPVAYAAMPASKQADYGFYAYLDISSDEYKYDNIMKAASAVAATDYSLNSSNLAIIRIIS